ncbi:MAG: alpha/beta fold hydrolase [Candidatus Hodarchaeota archaeon]
MPSEKILLNGAELFIEHDNLVEVKDWDLIRENPKKIPLLMVHGYTADHFRNYPVYEHLKDRGWPVICYDIRGHGWSQKGLKGTYTQDTCVEDIHAIYTDFLKGRFGYEQFNLYGHSMGGTLALMFANRYPVTQRLFLLAPWTLRAATPDVIEIFDLLLQGYKKRFEREFARKKREQSKLGLEFFPHWEDPTLLPEKEAAIEIGYDMLESDINYDILKDITIPVHLIIGKSDRPDLKASAKMLDEMLPNSTLDKLDCGHSYAIEGRELVKPLIEAYLKS